MPVVEEFGNIFDPKYNEAALAHCVGNDFAMGAGVAVEFRRRFGSVEWLRTNSRGVGTTLRLDHQGRSIFYLVSKPHSSWSKPTYESLTSCLRDLFAQMRTLHLETVVMPRIGCGLDGLNWDVVRGILRDLCPVEITVIAVTFA